MLAIDNIHVDDAVLAEEFVCDLSRCLGGCCVDGDCGAPLSTEEVGLVEKFYPRIKAFLPPENIAAIETQGTAVWDDEHADVTPTLGGGICAYGFHDEAGIVKCGFEAAYNEGLIPWKKPISCHLYPIRIEVEEDGTEHVLHDPRPVICKCGSRLGRKLKMPVYVFLKEALIRKYGEEFWGVLDAATGRINR